MNVQLGFVDLTFPDKQSFLIRRLLCLALTSLGARFGPTRPKQSNGGPHEPFPKGGRYTVCYLRLPLTSESVLILLSRIFCSERLAPVVA